jgi:hypothetical protein
MGLVAVADFSPRKVGCSHTAVIVGFVVSSFRVALFPSQSTLFTCQSSVQNAVALNSLSVLTLGALLSNFTVRHFLFISTSSTKSLTLRIDKSERVGSVHQFAGPALTLCVFRHNMKKMITCWLVNQHMILRQSLITTQKQAR